MTLLCTSDAAEKKRPHSSGSVKAKGEPPKKKPKQPQADAGKVPARSKSASNKEDANKIKWTKLEHGGVLFPPEYQPHGIKLKYDGVPVDLTPEQEEIATMYASMLETDYVTQKKKTFIDNFWAEFKAILGKNHVIKDLNKCDFRDMYNHLMAEREAKKNLSREVCSCS
jgi:DNA topoisomerase I